MKKAILTSSLTAVVCLTTTFFSQKDACAGDREWATVGKILTGIVGVGVIHEVFVDRHQCYDERLVYVSRPVYHHRIKRYHRPVYHRSHRHFERY